MLRRGALRLEPEARRRLLTRALRLGAVASDLLVGSERHDLLSLAASELVSPQR